MTQISYRSPDSGDYDLLLTVQEGQLQVAIPEIVEDTIFCSHDFPLIAGDTLELECGADSDKCILGTLGYNAISVEEGILHVHRVLPNGELGELRGSLEDKSIVEQLEAEGSLAISLSIQESSFTIALPSGKSATIELASPVALRFGVVAQPGIDLAYRKLLLKFGK